jgi:hypothetical protein
MTLFVHWCHVCEARPGHASVPSYEYCGACGNQMRMCEPPKRDVQREYEAACTALSNASNVVGLVWEYLKANPKASTTEAEERALQFVTWRTGFCEAAEARVDRLNAERKAMSE